MGHIEINNRNKIVGANIDNSPIGQTTPAEGSFTDFNLILQNPSNADLSGDPIVIEVKVNGTPYYIKVYPTKS